MEALLDEFDPLRQPNADRTAPQRIALFPERPPSTNHIPLQHRHSSRPPLDSQQTHDDPLNAYQSRSPPIAQRPCLPVIINTDAEKRKEARQMAFNAHLSKRPFDFDSVQLPRSPQIDSSPNTLSVPWTSTTPSLDSPDPTVEASSPSLPSSPRSRTSRLAELQLEGIRSNESAAMQPVVGERIRTLLPRRLQLSATWNLLYSLDRDGASLHTLYQNVQRGMRKEAAGGIVMVVLDSEGGIFGAFLNEELRPGREYYGSGESFVWTLTNNHSPEDPDVKTYRWTGLNNYLIFSNADFLSVGGGDGKFALWIDGSLEKGVSAKCDTFHNEVLSARSRTLEANAEGSFDIINLECWSIMS